MILPVRCFTCNKVLGQFAGKKIDQEFIKTQNIQRYCCKKILMTSVDIHDGFQPSLKMSFCKTKHSIETERVVIAR